MWWQRLALGLVVGAGAISAITIARAQTPEPLKILGTFTISTGLKLGGVEFGGLSGLDYDPQAKRFIALSDDRAERGPARFYDLALDLDPQGVRSLDVVATTALTDPEGRAYAKDAVDPEELRLLPGGTMVWADEGTRGGGPKLIEATRAGRAIGVFTLPPYYAPTADGSAGVRDNLGHEGLAVSPDRTRLVAVLENALAQDGPIATLDKGSRARLLVYDLATRQPVAEHVYETEAIPQPSTRTPPIADNGVSSAVYLSDGRLLVMERSFAAGVGNTIQIFEVALDGTTNVLGRPALGAAGDVTPVRKTRLATLKSSERGVHIDNLEAMSQGPDVDGRPTLVLASDNNFNRRGQVTQLVVVGVQVGR